MENNSQKEQESPALVTEIRPHKSRNLICTFADLPEDVLFAVFKRCDIQTLGRLCRVCHKFNTLIQSDFLWLDHRNHLLVASTSRSSDNRRRTSEKLVLKEHLRRSNNWIEKKYQEKVLLRLHPRQLPWLQYTDEALWVSTNNEIKCFNIQKDGRVKADHRRHLMLQDGRSYRGRRGRITQEYQQCPNLLNQDVSRFVVKNNLAVSGCRDGSLYIFDCVNGTCVDALYKIHRTDTQTVDFHDSCIISGSRDKTIKIISMAEEDCNNNPIKASIDMEDRVWSVAMAPKGQMFTAGTSGCRGIPSLSVWDIERVELVCSLGSYRYGAGILDMKYEDNNTLLTCGYDANLRMWDLRCAQCVREWQEPYDTTLYCLQSDGNAAMITGTARYGMIRLWDKRKQEAVQEYFLSQKSPVYSLAFDSSRLYAALDLTVNFMDFSIYPT